MSYGEDVERLRQEEVERVRKEAQVNTVVKQLLAVEAWQRLRRVEIVKPELARQVKMSLIQLYSAGKLNRRLSDLELKQLLGKLSESTKRDFDIRVI